MEDNNAVMTLEKWNSLSDADRCLLKQLGIKPVNQKETVKPKKTMNPITIARRLATKNTCPEEHYVSVKRTCGCCKTVTHSVGKMGKKKDGDNYLSFIEMEIPVGELYTSMKVTSIICGCCEDALSELSKEQLIQLVITLRQSRL